MCRNDVMKCIAGVFIVFFITIVSCSDTPSLSDIEQMNDRTPPVFYIEEPADGDVYGDMIRIRGLVVDKEDEENQEQRIGASSYYINGSEEGAEIPLDDDGTFLVSFSTNFLDGDVSILLEAIDKSGNRGTRRIDLVQTDGPDSTPQPTGPPLPGEYPPGTVWFEPDEVITSLDQSFITEVRLNSGEQVLAAYGIDVYYDFSLLEIDSSMANNGIEAGPEGFLAAVNNNTLGSITLSGFDASGTGPGPDLHILTFYWETKNTGSSVISLSIDSLIDNGYNYIGEPEGRHCQVTVND